MVANDLSDFSLRWLNLLGGFSVCVDVDSEPVLHGVILVSAIFPVIFVYKPSALRIIYILIRSTHLPLGGESSSLFTSYWQASEKTA